MTNLEKWNLIAGFIAPPVIALVQQTHWDQKLKALVAFAASCLIALGTVYWQGDLNFSNWLESMLTVFVAAIATYYGLWKPTTVAPTIEQATTSKPPAPSTKP